MIDKEKCAVVGAADGTWMLMDDYGRVEASLPPGFAANKASAKPMLMLIADAYNRGYGQCLDAFDQAQNWEQ